MGEDVIAYSRKAADDSAYARVISITNFGATPISIPDGTLLLRSDELDSEGQLPQDVTVWLGVE
jgi:alpha-glucosidase